MSTTSKLIGFGAGLVVVFAVAAGAGAAVGPIDTSSPDAEHPTHETPSPTPDAEAPTLVDPLPGGVSSEAGGFVFVPEEVVLDPSVEQTFTFRITTTDGAVVERFDTVHERELHLVVVSRNLIDRAHVHPVLDDEGAWSVALPPLPSGSYRAYADFRATGHDAVVLGVDLTVAGTPRPTDLPAAALTVSVDGFDVELLADPRVGDNELAFRITRDGAPVATEPYLGADAHLVAVRAADMAVSHVHPTGTTDGAIGFGAELPTAGAYRLFLEFSVGGVVHTASFTVDTCSAPSCSVSDTPTTTPTTHPHDDGGH